MSAAYTLIMDGGCDIYCKTETGRLFYHIQLHPPIKKGLWIRLHISKANLAKGLNSDMQLADPKILFHVLLVPQ